MSSIHPRERLEASSFSFDRSLRATIELAASERFGHVGVRDIFRMHVLRRPTISDEHVLFPDKRINDSAKVALHRSVRARSTTFRSIEDFTIIENSTIFVHSRRRSLVTVLCSPRIHEAPNPVGERSAILAHPVEVGSFIVFFRLEEPAYPLDDTTVGINDTSTGAFENARTRILRKSGEVRPHLFLRDRVDPVFRLTSTHLHRPLGMGNRERLGKRITRGDRCEAKRTIRRVRKSRERVSRRCKFSSGPAKNRLGRDRSSLTAG